MHFTASALVAALAAVAYASPIAPTNSFRTRHRTQVGFPKLEARNGTGGAVPVNAAGIALIEELEGFSADFYTIDGDQTIGYGHDCTQIGGCDSLNPPITEQEGQDLLYQDIQSYESCVCSLSNASGLNANQYAALVSFTYNSGCGGVNTYFGSDMEASDFTGICDALPSTNTLDGELSSRRAKEGALCSTATSDPSGC